jgi:hypothetical protein
VDVWVSGGGVRSARAIPAPGCLHLSSNALIILLEPPQHCSQPRLLPYVISQCSSAELRALLAWQRHAISRECVRE